MKKLNYLFASGLGIMALTGCTNMQADQAQFQPATQVVEKPVVVKPPDLKMQYQLTYGNNAALRRAYETYARTGNAPNIITEGFEQFAYGTGTQPVIAASPFDLTVISLEPGENVTNVSSGDPIRWSYSMAYSGQGALRQPHIMVKPSQPGIGTDLVITTDKRFYTLKMVSATDGKYVRDVRFWYPQEMQDFWEKYNAQQTQQVAQGTTISEIPNLNVNDLNFNYSVSTSGLFTASPSWKPLRVFDDGAHTYIQFKGSIASGDMPALFVLNQGTQELVNYRSRPPYFVVDKLFKQAVLVTGVGYNACRCRQCCRRRVLVTGVGYNQTKVVITNNNN